MLYALDAGALEDCHCRVRDLVRTAGVRFAAERRWEDVFCLFSCVPVHPDTIDPILFRLRSAAALHEFRRVTRIRRVLLVILAGVLVYLFLVSPTVFVHLENPYRVAHGMSELDWSEGLYWSVLTSTTVGYGDIVPQTPFGRMFSLFDALLGVTLMGVIAGLILGLVTPRRLS